MFKKILVPTDGSALAAKAIDIAADLAKGQGATLVGLYVIDPFPFIGFGEASSTGLQNYMAQAQSAAGHALDAVRHACEARGVTFMGDTIERNSPHQGILDTAQAEGCDLIVMGSHGRRGIQAVVLGSVAQKVLTHASVPVLVVKG